MGRKKVLDTYKHDPKNPVYRAKMNLRNARTDFEAEMDRVWKERAMQYRLALYRALLDAKERGVSNSELCRMYGTTSRNTILALLSEAHLALGGAVDVPVDDTYADGKIKPFSVFTEPYVAADGNEYTALRVVTTEDWRSLAGERYAGTLRLFYYRLGAVDEDSPGRLVHRFIVEDPGFDVNSPLQREVISGNLSSDVVRTITAIRDGLDDDGGDAA